MSRLSRAAGLVSVATLVSRVLGLLRDSVRAALFGSGWLSDALDVAFKVPNLFRDLFAEGAFSGAFVPTLTATRERDGHDAALALLNRVLSTLLVYVGLVVALLALGAPWIVRLIAAPEFVERSGAFDDAVLLVRVLAPFLLFICLAVAAMGTLNVWGRFFVPALSPATQNLVLVLGGIVVYQVVADSAAAALPWAGLLLLGGALQFVIQVPALLRAGWRPRFAPDLALATPAAREIVRRMLPVVAGLAATHVCILVNTRLATGDESGTSNLYYAFRLVHLPVGLVGVAVGTAVLAEASRHAALRDDAGVRTTLRESVLLCLALALPACAGLVALGEPIARLLFEWGRTMTTERAERIGETIRFFAPAVVFYCCVKVLVPVFYAQGRMRVPVVASVVAVVANLACAFGLHPVLRWNGLALAVAAGQAANLGVLSWALLREHGPPEAALLGRAGRLVVAAAACGAVAAALAAVLPEGGEVVARLVRALVPVAAGALAYFGVLVLLGAPEVALLRRALDRRRKPS